MAHDAQPPALDKRSHLRIARIGGQDVPVAPRQTLLDAALQAGVAFPYSCKVGGCGTCKCQITQGKVLELTESGYLLTQQELRDGYVLACQSVPQSDVTVAVELPQQASRQTRRGQVVAQTRLASDITALEVQLDAPLDYLPGQFADVTLDALPGETRSYSMAIPPDAGGKLRFVVRHVPGGAVSGLLHNTDALGQQLRVDGPSGDFWLRKGPDPLLFVAGGSGLAPILAILHAAVAQGLERPVTLLFGARTQADLYAQAELAGLAAAYKGPFQYLPVLSEAGGDASWTGARGLVTAHLAGAILPGAHAYLCGPPPMVDAAEAVLRTEGVPAGRIHADRFATKADAPRAVASSAGQRVAGALDYAKFFLFHVIGVVSVLAMLAGGSWITAGLLGVLVLYLLGDAVAGDDHDTPLYRYPAILTAQLWLALPLLVAIVGAGLWAVAPGDAMGLGQALHTALGVDLLTAKQALTGGEHTALVVLLGLMIGLVGTITAHELTHRTWDKVSLVVGRWLLAFSFDTIFAIEHVYGHHRYVSTLHDPATAPRGRNVYAHIVISSIRGNVSAWRIEAERLKKRRLPLWSLHNAFLRGQLMTLALLGCVYLGFGWTATWTFVLAGLWGKALLEIVNYMEHYGMVRDPKTPVQPRHSWNTTKRLTSWTMFNLSRHSHHHAQGEVPYHELRPYPDSPQMIGGYLSTIILTLIPPLWFRLMAPKVAHWDQHYASADEQRLARAAQQRVQERPRWQVGWV